MLMAQGWCIRVELVAGPGMRQSCLVMELCPVIGGSQEQHHWCCHHQVAAADACHDTVAVWAADVTLSLMMQQGCWR